MELSPNIWPYNQHLQQFPMVIFLFASLTAHEAGEKNVDSLRLNVCENFVCRPSLGIMLNFLAPDSIFFRFGFLAIRTLLFYSFCQMQTKPITKSTQPQPENKQNWANRAGRP